MTRKMLLAQILAQIPECDHSLASAYLLEFAEKLRTQGKQQLVDITNIGNSGYSAYLPTEVLSVQKVFANGLELSNDMDESEAVYLLYLHPAPTTATDDMLISEDEVSILMDEYGNPIELESA
jgi:hypothetical protein